MIWVKTYNIMGTCYGITILWDLTIFNRSWDNNVFNIMEFKLYYAIHTKKKFK